MLKMIGLSMILAASSAMGLRLAATAKRQQTQTLALIDAILRLRHELQCSLTPLPQAFSLLSRSENREIGAFFGNIATRVQCADGCAVGFACRRALTKTAGLCLPEAARQALISLFDTLGKYDLEGNLQALDLALSRLREQARTLRDQVRGRCRTYLTLGVCTGLAVAVILL